MQHLLLYKTLILSIIMIIDITIYLHNNAELNVTVIFP